MITCITTYNCNYSRSYLFMANYIEREKQKKLKRTKNREATNNREPKKLQKPRCR